MKVLLLTDTHIGFTDLTIDIWRNYLKKIKEDFDIILHTGDWISDDQTQWEDALSMFREFTDKPILGVKGNHDLWQSGERKKYIPSIYEDYYSRRELSFEFNNFESLTKFQNEMWNKYSIVNLNSEPFTMGDVTFIGWDGWYNSKPYSNDFTYMPKMEGAESIHMFLNRRASKSFGDVLANIETESMKNQKIVVATHHCLTDYRYGHSDMIGNPTFLKLLKNEPVDVFCFGHSHLKNKKIIKNGKNNDMRLFNAGSDYNSPNHIIFEI